MKRKALSFYPQDTYGRVLYYPKEEEGRKLCSLFRRTTLNKHLLDSLADAGVKFNLVLNPSHYERRSHDS